MPCHRCEAPILVSELRGKAGLYNTDHFILNMFRRSLCLVLYIVMVLEDGAVIPDHAEMG